MKAEPKAAEAKSEEMEAPADQPKAKAEGESQEQGCDQEEAADAEAPGDVEAPQQYDRLGVAGSRRLQPPSPLRKHREVLSGMLLSAARSA